MNSTESSEATTGDQRPEDDNPAFVITDLGGRKLEIYANGRVDGLSHLGWDKTVIVNRIPMMIEKVRSK